MKVKTGKYYEVHIGYNCFYVLEGSTIETDHDIVKMGPHIEICYGYDSSYRVPYTYKKSFDSEQIIEFKRIKEIPNEKYEEYVNLKSMDEALFNAIKNRIATAKESLKELEENAWGKWFFSEHVRKLKKSKEYIRRLQQFINRMEMKNEI